MRHSAAFILIVCIAAPSQAQFEDIQCVEKLTQHVHIAWKDSLVLPHWIQMQFKVPHANSGRFVEQLPTIPQSNPTMFKKMSLNPGFDLVQVRFNVDPNYKIDPLRRSICQTAKANEAYLVNWFFANTITVIDGYSVDDDYEWNIK